jgi:hypothetical protein
VDQHLIYFIPFLIVGFGIMLAPFASDNWPDKLVAFVSLCAQMANGIWVAGVAMLILVWLGAPPPFALVLSFPVMFLAGRYFARLAERWDADVREAKRLGWEKYRQRELDSKDAPEE